MGRTALYRHFDADGVLLYVGISNDALRLSLVRPDAGPQLGVLAAQTVNEGQELRVTLGDPAAGALVALVETVCADVAAAQAALRRFSKEQLLRAVTLIDTAIRKTRHNAALADALAARALWNIAVRG